VSGARFWLHAGKMRGAPRGRPAQGLHETWCTDAGAMYEDVLVCILREDKAEALFTCRLGGLALTDALCHTNANCHTPCHKHHAVRGYGETGPGCVWGLRQRHSSGTLRTVPALECAGGESAGPAASNERHDSDAVASPNTASPAQQRCPASTAADGAAEAYHPAALVGGGAPAACGPSCSQAHLSSVNRRWPIDVSLNR
jgi:hypothetical protein